MKKQILLIIAVTLTTLGEMKSQAVGQLCLSSATNYGTSSNPYTICYADFNNDGKIDLATANSFGKDVSVLLGTGIGTFGAATSFSVSAVNYPNGVCSADFNNDGNADIAVTIAFGGQNKVAVILGTGTFGPATSFSVGAGPIDICSGDFNVDGKMDLATANTSANNVSVVFGNGNGTFGPVTNIITQTIL